MLVLIKDNPILSEEKIKFSAFLLCKYPIHYPFVI